MPAPPTDDRDLNREATEPGGDTGMAQVIAATLSAHAAGDLDAVTVIVSDALDAGDIETASAALGALRPPDRADVFEELDLDQQNRLITGMDDEEAAEILEELDDEDRAELAGTLEPEELAPILDEMDPDEAADILGDLEPGQAERTLSAMDDEMEADVRGLLVFPEESAGGLMTPEFVALRAEETVTQSIERLRQLGPDAEATYYLYVVDADERLVGIVGLREMIVADPATSIGALMTTDVIHVAAMADQEDAARLMARYDLMALPVVDVDGRLVGVITHDDLVDVLQEEATEDMYRMVGVDEEARPMDSVASSIRSRLPWMVTNLGMQLVLVTVLHAFEPLFAVVPVLAVLLPLVSGNGGNVGSQTTTIMIRSMALGEIDYAHWHRLILKEGAVGLAIGLVIGILAGLISVALDNSAEDAVRIPLVILAAMALNLCAGAVAGVLVPFGLRRLGLDPAVASSVLVTSVTDNCGALFFLGLYYWLAT
jgi:magnesium transporter